MTTISSAQPENDPKAHSRRPSPGQADPVQQPGSANPSRSRSSGNVLSLQRLAGNRAVNARLNAEHRATVLVASNTDPMGNAIQRIVTMKDLDQNYPRTDGSIAALEGQVNQTLVMNDYDDLKATINQLRTSILSRQTLEKVNATTWTTVKKEQERFRLNREIEFIERLEIARNVHPAHVAFLDAQAADKAAAAAKKKKGGGWDVVGSGGKVKK